MATLERKKTWERIVDGEGVAVGDGDAATRPASRPPFAASVKINVEGAFIVDDETSTENGAASEFVHYEHKDIRLPHHTDVVSHIAVDVCLYPQSHTQTNTCAQIGGSLSKLVYFSREPGSAMGGGRLNFLNFETDRMDLCLNFIQELKNSQSTLNGSTPAELSIVATGGGAFKFYNRMRDILKVDVIREDEMECLIIGMDLASVLVLGRS